jgi:hypothetical protein
MLISIQLSSKLSNQKSEKGISENMDGTACVRRSVLLIMMILNIVVLVVQANDPPAPSALFCFNCAWSLSLSLLSTRLYQ